VGLVEFDHMPIPSIRYSVTQDAHTRIDETDATIDTGT